MEPTIPTSGSSPSETGKKERDARFQQQKCPKEFCYTIIEK
jgi:hypothetical protein